MRRLMVAGGGTGGHLFPGLAVAELWSRVEGEGSVLFVGSSRGIEAREVPKAGYPLRLLPVSGLRGVRGVARLMGWLRLPWSIVQALAVVWRYQPNAALSVGGYAAGPAVAAAWLLGVPCFVMEQNSIAGFTNRVLARLSRRVFTSFENVDFPPQKIAQLGNPVRSALVSVRESDYAPAKPLKVLVVGGSRGARALNQAVRAWLVEHRPAYEVLHQTGTDDLESTQSAYVQHGAGRYRAAAFIDDMAEAYRQADLVVCRAGATTVAELAVCGRPAIFVPFPHATDDHQSKNAQQVVAAGAALLLPEPELTPAKLAGLVEGLDGDRVRLNAMAEIMAEWGRPHAARDIVASIREECGDV